MNDKDIDIRFELPKVKNFLKVECAGMSMEVDEAMTITTPDGKIFMIYEDCGKWVLIAR